MIVKKTLPNDHSEIVDLLRLLLRLRLEFRWPRIVRHWLGRVAVNNVPAHFLCQFFSRLNPDQTLSLAVAAIKLDIAYLI